jgi:hypothetical protein
VTEHYGIDFTYIESKQENNEAIHASIRILNSHSRLHHTPNVNALIYASGFNYIPCPDIEYHSSILV